MAWNPTQYERFAAERHRPAADLIAALPDKPYRRIVDLGCGTGRVTAVLAERFPEAEIIGLDNDAAMLEAARATGARVEWREGDIAAWTPDDPPDLIYSNAALQWLRGHEVLFPKLLSSLAPGGVFAVQMPHHYDEASHKALAEIGGDGPWAPLIADRPGPPPMPPVASYYALLAPHAARVQLWRTTYYHPLQGEDPAFEWMAGTGMLPTRTALADHPTWLEEVSARYRAALRDAYPVQPDGLTLFSMSRMFFIAER